MSNNEDNSDEIDFKEIDQKILCQKCGREINKYSQFLHNTICSLRNDVDIKYKTEVSSTNISEQPLINKDENTSSQKTDIDEYIKYYEEKIRKMREGNIYPKEQIETVNDNKVEQPEEHTIKFNQAYDTFNDKKSEKEEIDKDSYSDDLSSQNENNREKEFISVSQHVPSNLITLRTENNNQDALLKPDAKESNISNVNIDNNEDSYETDLNKEVFDEIASGKDEFLVKTNLPNEQEELLPFSNTKQQFKETNFSKKSYKQTFEGRLKESLDDNNFNEIKDYTEDKVEVITNNAKSPSEPKDKITVDTKNINETPKDTTTRTPKQQKAKTSKIIPNSTNNNSSPKREPVVSTELLEKIEKTQNISNEETKRQLEEIQSIESSLKLDQRLIHEKWQIRKNAFREVANIIEFLHSQQSNDYDPNDDNELNQALDTFSPWMLYFLTDTNITTLAEGLQTFYIFMKISEKHRHKALFLFFDELEKIISFNKSNILDLCEKTIEVYLCDKKLKNFCVNELLKKMVVKNNKLSSFATDIIVKNLDEFNETYIKLIFEKAILHFSNTESKSIERKKVLSRIIVEIYKILCDTFDIIRKNINISTDVAKELEKILKKVDKVNPTCRLYKLDESETLKRSVLQAHQQPNIVKTEIAKTEDVDLLTILPENFKDFTYITQINKKVEILKSLNNKLSQVKSLALKDYKAFYDILDYAIEDSNVLVHLEAIKILSNLCGLLQMHINYSKLKVLLYSCFDKFTDNKTNVKIQLFTLFDTLLFNFCMQIENFLDFTLQFVAKQKNTNVKHNILEYIKSLFEDISKDESRNIKINGLLNNMDDGNLVSIVKLITDVIKNENSPQVKDISTDIIILVKSRINDQSLVDKYIENLPKHRKQLLSQDYCSEKVGKNINFSKEPKVRSQKCKANISYNSRKELNMSVNKEEKPKVRTESKSTEKNSTLHNTLQDKLKSKVKENIKNKVNLPKFNNKKVLNTTNQDDSIIANNNNIKVIKAEKKQQISVKNNKNMNTSIKEKTGLIIPNNNDKLVETSIKNTNEMNTLDSQQKEEDKSYLDKESLLKIRVDPVLKHINSLEPCKINDYANKLIKDFLIFVKKATSKQSGEDLSVHFIVIIHILDKLFEKIDKNNYNEILIQSTKIIIVSPCFLKDNQQYFDDIIEKLRQTLNNEQRFFNVVIGVLEKFNTTSSSSTFLKNIDPKISFIAVFNYFIKNKFEEIVLQALKKIIDNCLFLSVQEKTDFKNKIDFIVNSSVEKDNEDEDFESCGDNNDSPERNKVDFQSSLLKERININTYQDEKYENKPSKNVLMSSPKSEKSDECEDKLLTNDDFEKDKFNVGKGEEISIIKKRSHSHDINSDEDKLHKNLEDPKNQWIEKYREETHIETLTNLEKTSKDYMVQINENEKLKEKLSLLIKQNQQLMHGIEKYSEKKEKAIPQRTMEEQIIPDPTYSKHNLTTKYDNEISNLKAMLNDKCKSLEQNIKQVENKLTTKSVTNQIVEETNVSVVKKTENDSSDFKLFKPIKSLENFNDQDNIVSMPQSFPSVPIQKPDFTSLILKIPSQLLDSEMNVTLYVKLETLFSKLDTEDRFNFIEQIKELVLSNELMNTASFNSMLLFFEFIVSLLVFEIKNGYKYTLNQKDLHRNMIFKAQENIENLIKRQKNLTNFFIFQIQMLKKYLPKDFKIPMERDSLIYVKIVTHLLKSSNETLVSNYSEIFILDILKETNELFIKFPSQNLMYGIPNLEDLDKVYSQLRVMVDLLVQKNISKTQLFIKSVKQQGIYCPIFIQYLDNLV